MRPSNSRMQLPARRAAADTARSPAGQTVSIGGMEPMLNCWKRLMRKVEKIEQDVQALSPDELAEFRAWFLEHDWAAWDRQLERDVQNGKLDALAEKALRDHAAGKTTRL